MIPQGKMQIAAAMRKLLRKKTLAGIRVTELCRAAGTGRQTFYYHFRDKHDLMAWMFLQSMGDLDITSLSEVTAALERMKEDYVFYARACEDTEQAPFWRYMLEYYAAGFEARAREILGTAELDAETRFLIRFYNYDGFAMTHDWLTKSDRPAAA